MLAIASLLLLAACQNEEPEADAANAVVRGNPDRADSERLQKEWFTRMGGCLTEAGFPSKMEGDVLTSAGAVGRQDDFDAAWATCEESLGEIPGSDPLTPEELGTLYDLYVEADECLRENGLPVTAQMPSKDTWVAQEIQAMTDPQAEPPPLPFDGLLQHQYEEVCPCPSGEDIFDRMNGG